MDCIRFETALLAASPSPARAARRYAHSTVAAALPVSETPAACITRADCPAEGGAARVGPSEDNCIFAP